MTESLELATASMEGETPLSLTATTTNVSSVFQLRLPKEEVAQIATAVAGLVRPPSAPLGQSVYQLDNVHSS